LLVRAQRLYAQLAPLAHRSVRPQTANSSHNIRRQLKGDILLILKPLRPIQHPQKQDKINSVDLDSHEPWKPPETDRRVLPENAILRAKQAILDTGIAAKITLTAFGIAGRVPKLFGVRRYKCSSRFCCQKPLRCAKFRTQNKSNCADPRRTPISWNASDILSQYQPTASKSDLNLSNSLMNLWPVGVSE
jgi:hypothetical protein